MLAAQSSGPLESSMSAAESERERVRRLERLQEIDDVAPHLKALKRLTDAKLFPPIYTNCFYRHIQRFRLKSSGALSPCNSQRRGLSPRPRSVMGRCLQLPPRRRLWFIVPGAKSHICGGLWSTGLFQIHSNIARNELPLRNPYICGNAFSKI